MCSPLALRQRTPRICTEDLLCCQHSRHRMDRHRHGGGVMPCRPGRIPVTRWPHLDRPGGDRLSDRQLPSLDRDQHRSTWLFPVIVDGAARGADRLADAAGAGSPSHIPSTGTVTAAPPDTEATKPWSPSAPTGAWPLSSTPRPGAATPPPSPRLPASLFAATSTESTATPTVSRRIMLAVGMGRPGPGRSA